LEEIAVQPTTGKHADGPGEPLHVVTGGLQSFPGTFEENAVLRVHHLGDTCTDTEKPVIEEIDIGEDPFRPNVIGKAQQIGGDAGSGQLLFGEHGDRLDPGAQVGPQLSHRRRAGESARQSDDGDLVAALLAQGPPSTSPLRIAARPRRAIAARRFSARSSPSSTFTASGRCRVIKPARDATVECRKSSITGTST